MLDLSRYFCIQTFYFGKIIQFAQLSISPCSAVTYKLIQKAKSTPKELRGSPQTVEQVSGFCLQSAWTEPPVNPQQPKELLRKRSALQTCSTFPENARGVIYANTTMRINHMFVSLRIAMCQTFTGEK